MEPDPLDALGEACEDALTQLSEPPGDTEATLPAGPIAVPVRAPRTSRANLKRGFEEVEAAQALLVPTSPGKLKRPAAKRPAKHLTHDADANKKQAPRRARAPRSPDEKRKLSRQMAAFMRYGVLVLPADVKARSPGRWGSGLAAPGA